MQGTMLELAVLTEGNETEMVAALEAGYTLTGNFKGGEMGLLLELAAAADEKETL
jgi:hypothetical protein